MKPFRLQTTHMAECNGLPIEMFGADIHTKCGKIGSPIEGTDDGFTMLSRNGDRIKATSKRALATCIKCNNLIANGTLCRR